jgi:hypothetical protein
MMRRFYLHRDSDPSGVSGCGRVADGVMFDSGCVALHFDPTLKRVRCVYIYLDLADMYLLHGHKGKTRIVWIDDEL